ncbi:patatin-like phospholipase family protein [Muricoccus nepalensis]|uniref:patatin-like phospholipase family protein n=1 Tax=Muricoccus nepalensis TaxID=1854500 RepID=UPI0019D51980|nr:patatin-like phospholipase family protein [Roseomonas nepalensis]
MTELVEVEGGSSAEALDPVVAPPSRHALLVFEGGGAKGIIHIGALRALEDPRFGLNIVGTAGTSAGSIAARLVAAEFASKEIIDAEGKTSVLGSVGMSDVTLLFGPVGLADIDVCFL